MALLKKLLGLFANHDGDDQHAPTRVDLPYRADGHEDIIKGYRYSATLQMRTPLRILQAHGRFVPLSGGEPPVISTEMWHGIWLPVVSLDSQFDCEATMASEVGYVPSDGGDYLHFLIQLRTITESGIDPEDMLQALGKLMEGRGPGGTEYVKYISASELTIRVIPRTIDTLPVPSAVRGALYEAGVRCLRAVDRMSEEELLAFKGIGPKSVVAIRAHLRDSDLDFSAERYLSDVFQGQRDETK